MAAVALIDRVQRQLRAPGRTEQERVNDAIESIAEEVDYVTQRLAVIDPEWELLARQEIDQTVDLVTLP